MNEEIKDAELTWPQLIAWHNDLAAIEKTLQSRLNKYPRKSKAKGKVNLNALMDVLAYEMGMERVRLHERRAKADVVKTVIAKRIRQLASLVPDDPSAKILMSILPTVNDEVEFDYAKLHEVLVEEDLAEPEWWLQKLRDNAESNMHHFYSMGRYGEMNRAAEELAKLEEMIDAYEATL